MHILVVDDDRTTRQLLSRLVGGLSKDLDESETAGDAIQKITALKEPALIFLDWILPDVDGQRVCRIVRDKCAAIPHYIVLMSARATRKDIANGLNAGADDFLTKPIPPDVLKSRLRLAKRHLRGSSMPSAGVLAGLKEASASGSGELLVRDGYSVARIAFHEGRVAWVHIPDGGESLAKMFSADGLEGEDLRAAVDEARKTGSSFHEVLLNWGLVTAERLDSVLRDWIRRRMYAVVRFHTPQVLFIPTVHSSANAPLSFALSEVLSEEDLSSLGRSSAPSIPPSATDSSGSWHAAFVPPERPNPAVEQYLGQVMSLEGAVTAAVIDRASGVCEGFRGETKDPTVVWSKIRVLNSVIAGEEQVEDVVLTTKDEHHLLMPVSAKSDMLCYLVVQRSLASVPSTQQRLRELGGF